MTTLLEALQTEDIRTLNGMVTNSSSKDANVDLFFHIGAMRGQDPIPLFAKAFAEDPLTALKIIFWCRDVRGGAGERQLFRDVVTYLALHSPDVLKKNIHLFSEYGRWDDVLTLLGTPLESDALDLIGHGLTQGDGLLAKWLPRKGPVANKIRKYLGVSPKVYRKTLVGLSQTVEQSMCAKSFGDIDYEKVPSLAMSRYIQAFYRNDESRFSEFKNRLAEGTAKVNAGALYPYDITKAIEYGSDSDNTVQQSQWDSLPNYMEGNEKRVLPLVDVSGSMSCRVGGNSNLTCLDVAISLGLYISERNEGIFKDAFITFSANPKLQYLKGTLTERLYSLVSADWGYNTDLEKVFQLVLGQALKHDVSPEEMPTDILILSDMQFDQADESDSTALKMIKDKYVDAGYEVPNIIFWNLNSYDGVPASFDEDGTALISGFSPSILKSVLAGENITPVSIMMKTIGSSRYDLITI